MRGRTLIALIALIALAAASGCGDDGSLVDATTVPPSPATSGPTAGDTTVPDTTVPDTTVPETTVPETTVPSDTGLRWERVSDDDGVLGGTGSRNLSSVTVGGPGLVAVGYDDSPGNRNAAVWTSEDGLTWERVQHRPRVFGQAGEQVMYSVTAGGPGLVAVGYDDASGDWDGAVWTSVDGFDWKRVADDDAVFGGPGTQAMTTVTTGGPGLVAVGYDGSGPDWDAAVWTSEDGETWQRVPHSPRVFGGPLHQAMYSVTAGGPGLVAVGYDGSLGSEEAAAAVWTSVDGSIWTRVPHDDEVFGGDGVRFLWSVAAGDTGVVAVGYEDSGEDWDAAVWISADGNAWERVPHDPTGLGGPNTQAMRSVVWAGPGWVALGTDSFGGDLDAAVWTSSDGIVWEYVIDHHGELGGASTQEITDVTRWGDMLIAVGYDNVGEDRHAAVWISPPPE